MMAKSDRRKCDQNNGGTVEDAAKIWDKTKCVEKCVFLLNAFQNVKILRIKGLGLHLNILSSLTKFSERIYI
jgi:hypothetical protein